MSYAGGEDNLDIYPETCMYFVTIMKVIRRCGDGKNAFSENIGQTWLSQDNVKTILEIKNVPVFILCHLIEFYYHIFLDIEKEITSHQLHALHSIIKYFISHLSGFTSALSSDVKTLNRYIYV